MLWVGEECLLRCALDWAAGIHHQDFIGDLGDNAHIVGNDDDRGIMLFLETHQEIKDLCLNRYIERGRWLISDK